MFLKSIIKKVIISMSIIMVSFFPIIYSKADFDFTQMMQDGKKFVQDGSSSSPDGFAGYDSFQQTSTSVGNVLMVVGMGIAVVIAGVLGIQMMTGTVEKKAEVKAKVLPFIIGCLVIFGAFGIWKLVLAILNSTFK